MISLLWDTFIFIQLLVVQCKIFISEFTFTVNLARAKLPANADNFYLRTAGKKAPHAIYLCLRGKHLGQNTPELSADACNFT